MPSTALMWKGMYYMDCLSGSKVCNGSQWSCVQVLKPLQQARMHVASYPWPPDTLALCALIAADTSHGNPQHASNEVAQSMQGDFTSLLMGLPERSPFRMLAQPLPMT